ncbi:hypothetical protein [Thermus sp.]|uniref:hypothetical protein n=1 Tax=Thermus sp. TaxID=275 RepID=UPI003D14C308
MVKVGVRSLYFAARAQVGSVEEALEALRKLWKEDDTVRELLAKAAKEGYVLVDAKDVPAPFVAAVKVALARLRERLGEEKPSTLVVKGGKGKEERKVMTWESPEGVRYRVEPYDLAPREERHWAYRDKRVEDAAKWVERFLSMAEHEEGRSPLEEALEHEDNPHFRREDLIPEDLEAGLRLLGWDGTLRNLQALVDTLPAREKAFVERVRSIAALVDREGGKAQVVAVKTPVGWEVKVASKPVLNAVLSVGLLQEAVKKDRWSTKEVRWYLEDVKPFVPGLEGAVEAIATLRKAKYLLEELGRGRKVAVYRDPATGEPVYRTPVIG